MKRAATFLAALTLGIFAMLGTDTLSAHASVDPDPSSPPTQQVQDVLGGEISHYFPDDNYDPLMWIKCGAETVVEKFYLREGWSSRRYPLCDDANKVWVPRGADIWCKYGIAGAYEWKKRFSRSRWRSIANQFDDGLGCTFRKQ